VRDVTAALDLQAVDRQFTDAPADDVLRWAGEEFGDQLVVTSSFADAVLAHLSWSVLPGVEVVLLDTQYLFAETVWFARHVQQRFGGRLRIVTPGDDVQPDDRWLDDVDGCCGARKVQPLERLLADRAAWVTGLRRDDHAGRAGAPIVARDLLRGVVKVNPIAAWTDADVAAYSREHDLPVHPLVERGYASIGCWPCTVPVAEGSDPRSGRWAGRGKTECGLHLPAVDAPR
jgi:phosphoadenosine phosphosulfate reductase